MVSDTLKLDEEHEIGYIASCLNKFVDKDILCDEISIIIMHFNEEQLNFVLEDVKRKLDYLKRAKELSDG